MLKKKKIKGVIKGLKKASKLHAKQAKTLKGVINAKKTKVVKAAEGGRIEYSKGTMPRRNKKNFRPTEKGAGMTKAGVAAYRR